MAARPWVVAASVLSAACSKVEAAPPGPELVLAAPRTTGSVTLESAMARRRTQRTMTAAPLALDELGQLLWATQGVTEPKQGLRIAPSAGALYPLEVYLAKSDGLYHYVPGRHVLVRLRATDARPAIAKAAFDQDVVRKAPVLFVVTGVLARTRAKYGTRAERYVAIEAGHAVQGMLLQATALGLATTPVGAFEDDALRTAIGVDASELPLYVIAVGHPAS